METGHPSSTAVSAARSRAAHLFLDDEPKIFNDPFALGLGGFGSEAALRTEIETRSASAVRRLGSVWALNLFRYPRAMMTMRSRYTEDALDQAIERGVTQYVILGAGLDSFAFRRLDLVDRLRIFEVDYPASQQWKQNRLRELHLALPSNLNFIPIDFETQTLAKALTSGGYDPEAPAFLSWLGVTQYLTEEAVLNTLKQVASLTSGTEIIMTYLVPEALLDQDSQRFLAINKSGAANRGEPWVSFFEPAVLTAQMRQLGFDQISHFSPAEANARYFASRTDGLCLPGLEHLMQARVGRVDSP
ncbi:MAG: hypothetical protein ETSY1_35785 [Candidatus Entotheonella factor]|uniref:S-adenosyl-L-methionine-dependent methyltransferase n=1 Tax=Entotheonella factor TaxID=1429438 RepID=W4L832_ENTF1|nr:MAG: hypothetical protein ETSY1_35785 [Candidatus Entotheonella factor]